MKPELKSKKKPIFKMNKEKAEFNLEFDCHPVRIVNAAIVGRCVATIAETAMKGPVGMAGKVGIMAGTIVVGQAAGKVVDGITDKVLKEKTGDKKMKIKGIIFKDGFFGKVEECEINIEGELEIDD